MAMEEPCTRIVRLESNHEPTAWVQHVGVAPSRIVKVERRNADVSEIAVTFAEDVEVVAMQMHRVW